MVEKVWEAPRRYSPDLISFVESVTCSLDAAKQIAEDWVIFRGIGSMLEDSPW